MRVIASGWVLEAAAHGQAQVRSYDDMTFVGTVRVATDDKAPVMGDDLNDAPFAHNGSIHSGKQIELQKGDFLIVVRGGAI